jgi:DNA-directed RNA polymerase specialized sigma24 family protein
MEREKAKEWELTKEEFDKLLQWLNPDRDRAAEEYESIRRKLIEIFVNYGSHTPDELADLTIDCVVRKLDKMRERNLSNPAKSFSRTAFYIMLEWRKKRKEVQLLGTETTQDEDLIDTDDLTEIDKELNKLELAELEGISERLKHLLNENTLELNTKETDEASALRMKCLKESLQRLKEKERNLILDYYEYEKGEKIKKRKRIAELLGIGLNTLRQRKFRTERKLKKWVQKCISRKKITRNDFAESRIIGDD